MLVRLVLAATALGVVFAAYRLWKRPPRRLSGASLVELGVAGPAIVQFSTRSCAPCRTARPKLIEAAAVAEVDYAQIELDERPEVAGQFGIRSVPTIVVTGPGGAVRGVWTTLPANGEITEAARRAKPA